MAPAESPFADHGEQNSEYSENTEDRGGPHAPAPHLRASLDDLPVSTKSATLARSHISQRRTRLRELPTVGHYPRVGPAVGVANHQRCPSRSRAPYSRCPYGWSTGCESMRAPAARARSQCASTSSTYTNSPVLATSTTRGEASPCSGVTR